MQLFLHKNLQQHMQKALAYLMFFLSFNSQLCFAHDDGGQVDINQVETGKSHPTITLNTKSFTVAEGLSQNTVTSIAEDGSGYIWVGTLNGLNRFNGDEFKKFHANDGSGLESSFIQSLNFSNGKLLVGTDDGLYVYNENSIRFRKLPINGKIWSISTLQNNTAIGTDNSVILLDQNLEITKVYKNEYFSFVKKVVEFNGIYIARNYDGDVIQFSEELPTATKISYNAKNIGIVNGELNIDKENVIEKINSNRDVTKKFQTLSATNYSNNTKTYIEKNRIYQESNGKKDYLGTLEIEKDLSLPAIYESRLGIFLTGVNRGIILIPNSYNLVRSLSSLQNNVWSIFEYKDTFIIADDSEYIKYIDTSLNVVDKVKLPESGFKVAVVFNDEIYFSSETGVYRLPKGSLTPESIYDEASFTITTDETGIIFSNKESTVLKYHPDSNAIESLFLIDRETPIFQIVAHKNDIFLAHQGGVTKWNRNTKKIENIYTESIAYSIKVSDAEIYIGTDTGMSLLPTSGSNERKVFDLHKPIYSLAYKNGIIVGSSIGQVILYKHDKIITLTAAYGSQEEYNSQSAASFGAGFLLGGIGGISYLELDKVEKYTSTVSSFLDTEISELYLFNSPVPVGSSPLTSAINTSEEVSLKYSDYPFSFQFSSPRMMNDSVNFEYRLIGLSDDWIPSKGLNLATYTNLSPGNYVFEVYAVESLSGQKGQTHRLNVKITPPWWMSREAKLAYALMVIVVSITIMKAILRRREVQRQIAISEERLKLSLWGSGDEMWDWDIETGKIYRSNIWGSLEFPKDGHRSGRGDEESNIHPQDQERVREALNRHFYGETDHFEAAYRVKGKDGNWVWILDRAKIVERDDSDNALRMTGTIKNINNFKQAEEQLKLFERAIENISEGMFILDNDFRFVEVNEACCDICMLDRDSFIGTVLHFACYPDVYSEQVRIILRQQGRWSAEVESKRGDNSTFLMELTVDAIYDEQGTLSHFVGVFSDISRRKMQEEELRKLTNNDLLTGLPNRSNLQVSLSNLVKKDTHHTLMVLDLDNFKKINDSLGHQIGDELLLMVSRRMSGALPAHTSLYRLGGDEFAILIDKEPDIGSSAAIAKGVVDAFVAPFELAGEKLVVGVSIGIVLYPEDEQNEQALLRKADIAMYHAKSAGGNRYQFYSESLNRNAMRQLEVENLIREGLRDDLFEVYYQPKIDLRSSRMAGMEALVRLVHPVHGLIPPSEFIPLAEETGLIVEIGDLVMRKACFAAQKWREQGIFDGRVAVNLSSRQFALPDLQQRIESILRLTQLPAGNLELEITEGTVIKQPEKAIKVMQQLAKMGVSLALDDFGTGYSSLSYLKRFPIHTLKIDKAFVDDIDKSDRDLKMVDSIITIAHNMGLTVVGEGVEVPSQLNILRALKCEEIQGYIYSKAVPEQEFSELLRQDLAEFLAQKYNQR